MKVADIAQLIGVTPVYIADADFEITRGYCCDLLSEVIGRAEPYSIWVTVHNNMNVLGVAVMIEIKAIIITEGHEVSDEFLNKAKEEGISLFRSEENSFSVTGKLYREGIK